MKKTSVKGIISFFATAMLLMALSLGTALTAFADDDGDGLPAPSGVSINTDGTVSWDAPAETREYEVDKYEAELWREKNNEFKSYKKKTVRDDEECTFSFGYIARYKARVRAVYIGGRKSGWSEWSDIISVSRDDIDNWGSDNDGPPANYNRPYNPGPGYVNGQPVNNYYGTSYGPGNGNGGGVSGNSGWVQGEGGRWWYKYYDGSYPRNCWQSIDGKWYFFDNNGYMTTGWIWYNNSWYLCLPDGQMATGWRNVNEKWYYLNESGVMLTGYQTIDGKTYYMDATGARVSNTTTPDGHVFDVNGVMVK